MPKPSIQPKRCEVDGIWFDSHWERNVYLSLDLMFPGQVEVHSPVFVASANNWFPEWNWKCDFRIKSNGLLIESKSAFTLEGDGFRNLLRSLAQNNPEAMERLLIVTPKGGEVIAGRKLKALSLPQLMGVLRKIKEQQQ